MPRPGASPRRRCSACTADPARTPSASASPDRCGSSCRDLFRRHADLLPGPAALQPHDAALLAGRIDDERERIVEPVVHALPRLVRKAQTQMEAPVRERQLLGLETRT